MDETQIEKALRPQMNTDETQIESTLGSPDGEG
jgi:hypothetical protein